MATGALGVVAAGSRATAEAGAEILRRGGNAVDAAVAACFATAAGEPSLTSLAGGGILIHRDAASGAVTVCDFFADAPSTARASVPVLDFFAVDLDFGPTKQRFHIGRGAAALPGVIPGLCQTLARAGTLSLAEVIAPACRLLREGAPLDAYQGRALKLLEPILTLTAPGREIFAPAGRILGAGDRFALPALADTLEAMAARGWDRYYAETLVPAMLAEFGREAGGRLSHEDVRAYRVELRRPSERRYHATRVLVNPPPAAGGTMIGLMLELLALHRLEEHGVRSARHARLLCEAMAVADETRAEGEAVFHPERFARACARFAERLRGPRLERATAPAARPSTTHVSVIDAAGNAVGVTFSYGEGCGHLIGASGIMMNNLLGEEDLFPHGFDAAPPGVRLPTMMSPTLLIGDDGAVTVMGTGGANRIRTAIVQVMALLVDHGLDVEEAVRAARLHFEGGVLNAEVLGDEAFAAALAGLGADRFVRFDEPNLFFGGVHVARRGPDGTLSGAGDPRRGGACVVANP